MEKNLLHVEEEFKNTIPKNILKNPLLKFEREKLKVSLKKKMVSANLKSK